LHLTASPPSLHAPPRHPLQTSHGPPWLSQQSWLGLARRTATVDRLDAPRHTPDHRPLARSVK
jgi:hypothetical protein